MKEKNVKIIRAEDVISDMMHDLVNGLDKGTSTYIPELDEAWTWRKTEVNLYTGYANEGKSQWMRFISIIKALEERKRFYLFAPEDAPATSFYDDLIHTITGKSTDKDNPNFIGVDLYEEAYKLIKDLIFFISVKTPHNTIENIVDEWEKIKDEDPDAFGFLIDPFVRMTRSNNAPERDDLYAAYVMSILTDFSREYDVCTGMVMHQNTPQVDTSGYYPEPNMYKVKCGGTFADMTDNLMSIWRPRYAKEKMDTEVRFKSQKIKKQKLVGIPQELKFRFERKWNQYTEFMNPDIPIYDFSKFFNKKKVKYYI